MKKIFSILAMALLLLAGCSKNDDTGAGTDKFTLKNSQWIYEGRYITTDKQTTASVIDFDLTMNGKAALALVCISSSDSSYPVGTNSILELVDYTCFEDEKGELYSVQLGEDMWKINVVDNNTIQLTDPSAPDTPVTVRRVENPYKLNHEVISLTDVQWQPVPGSIYDFNLHKKGCVTVAQKGDDGKYYEQEISAYREEFYATYTLIDILTEKGGVEFQWKVEKVDENTAKISVGGNGEFEPMPVSFVRVAEPVTIYPKK